MKLGQHFLKDQEAIDLIVATVAPGSIVVEVGAGRGELTSEVAKKAAKVIAFEIDPGFKPSLDQLARNNRKIKIFYEDFLKADLDKLVFRELGGHPVQIVANLPFHILEPFLHKISQVEIRDAVVMVGKKVAFSFLAGDNDHGFGQVSLLAQTFFDIKVLSGISRESFEPAPRTATVIVRLVPKKPEEYLANKYLFIFKRLFLTSSSGPLVKNAIKEGLIEYSREKRKSLTQRQAKGIVEDLSLPEKVLNKPFQQLNNNELKMLSKALL